MYDDDTIMDIGLNHEVVMNIEGHAAGDAPIH
jgi:hypothetical protein